jgi:hypothetical protein
MLRRATPTEKRLWNFIRAVSLAASTSVANFRSVDLSSISAAGRVDS